jgi:hypothetical protein
MRPLFASFSAALKFCLLRCCILLCCCLGSGSVWAQFELIPKVDYLLSCKPGQEHILDPPSCPMDPTIQWTEQGDKKILGTKHSLKVSPQKTTTYIRSCIHQSSGQLPVPEYIVTVVVIEKFKLITKLGVPGKCMQGEIITCTATITGVIPSGANPVFSIDFKGISLPNVKTVSPLPNVADFTFKVPMTSSASHIATIMATAHLQLGTNSQKCDSNELSIEAYELWVKTFQNKYPAKPWKVVIGTIIEYEASALYTTCTDWQWTMPDNNIWHPKPYDASNNNVIFKQSGEMRIPFTDTPTTNAAFGDANGTVKVSCKDANNNKYVASAKAKVFFQGIVNKEGNISYDIAPPNWFVFWKEGKVVGNIEKFSFENLDGYAEWKRSPVSYILYKKAAGTNNGTKMSSYTVNGNVSKIIHTGTGVGINCLAEVMAHELHHEYIVNTWKGVGDTDGDELPTSEEENPSDPLFLNIKTDGSNPDCYNLKSFNPSYGEIGDSELRCRVLELNKNKVESYCKIFSEKNWSASDENANWKN